MYYSNLKVFNYYDHLKNLISESDIIKGPLHVRVKPTNLCNHHCWYCCYRSDLQLGSNMQEKDQISEKKMMEIVDNFVEMQVQAVTFSGGGEPFLYKYLLKTAERLEANKISFAAYSNGSRLDGQISEYFAHHASWLRISVDAYDDQSYSKSRGVRLGEFSRLLKNLKNFKKFNGTCTLSVNYVVGHDNAQFVYETVSKLIECDIDYIKISPCIISDDMIKNNNYHSSITKSVKEQIKKLTNQIETQNIVNDAYELLNEKFEKTYNWCPYLQLLCVIGADLNVYTCQDKAYSSLGFMGSIANKSFKQFWEYDWQKFYRLNPSIDCKHHCVANEKNIMLHEFFKSQNKHMGFI
jgi:MoaA/NifB/PqqE/SkfB family radical SAM enzyme